MKLSGNTILITGGASGIGLGLAEQFQKRGNTVLIAGRSKKKLAAVEAKGFKTFTVDLSQPGEAARLAKEVMAAYPKLNVVIQNAGVSKPENLLSGEDYAQLQQEMVTTNFIGPMQLTSALLPTLQKQESGAVITVSSGLAFVPLAAYPTYCATKAAIHSYTQSLRYQLRNTKLEVIEIAPPYVQTELGGEQQAHDPRAMPLAEYIAEVFSLLERQPQSKEVVVERTRGMREAQYQGAGHYDQFFNQLNQW